MGSLGASNGEKGVGGGWGEPMLERPLARPGGWLDIRLGPSNGLSGMLPTGVRRDRPGI
jgi:hypothetical protein